MLDLVTMNKPVAGWRVHEKMSGRQTLPGFSVVPPFKVSCDPDFMIGGSHLRCLQTLVCMVR